jgi:general secretion pathway protein D
MNSRLAVRLFVFVPLAFNLLLGCTASSLVRHASEGSSGVKNVSPSGAKIQAGTLGRFINDQNIWLSKRWIEIDQALENNEILVAKDLIDQVAKVDPTNPRLKGARLSLQARQDPPKQAPLQQLVQASNTSEIDFAIGKRVPVLEFRDAPLRAVMEALGRLGAVNFVFDKDVRTDTRVSVSFKEASIRDVLRSILLTQQLDFKALNSNSIVIYPNTAAKIRDYVDLQSRSFFLDNIDVKQAQVLIRTLVKTKDIFIDEKLNLLVMKDSPAAIRYAEQLLESVDQAEPEVVLDVQVLEVSESRTREIGLKLPAAANLGLPSSTPSGTELTRGNWAQQIVSIASPSISASLTAGLGDVTLLSNPSIRVKNREKARIHIGEKLPVFTSIFNSTGASGGAGSAFSTQVTLLEVGLKLDVEPLIHMSKDVEVKLSLEVSNVLEKVSGPAQSIAYRVGTRNAVTNLRLRDGETQILAGLIRDDDRHSAVGVPGLFELPILGRLFGQHTESKDKTEIILLITPRVVRSISAPLIARGPLTAGTEGAVGVTPLRMSERSSIAVSNPVGTNPGGAAAARTLPGRPSAPASASASTGAAPPSPDPSVAAVISLRLTGPSSVKANTEFDVGLLRSPEQSPFEGVVEVSLNGEGAKFADGSSGSRQVSVAGGQASVRVKAGAAGSEVQIAVIGAKGPGGDVAIETSPQVIQIKVEP